MFTKKGTTLYHCHNCNITYGFDKFLKEFDQQVYNDYCLDRLKEKGVVNKYEYQEFEDKFRTPIYMRDGVLKGLKKVSQLPAEHPCKKYVVSRQIPNPYHAKLFYAPKFFSWCNSVVPGKFSEGTLKYDEPRLIIPFINKDQQVHAFQGRSFDPKAKSKYITIVTDESIPKVYGLDTVDFSKKTYVFEGPIDSVFIPNSIATAGGDLISALKDLKVPKKNLVIIYDNEPRSKETKSKLEKAIINGYTVCIWPSNMEAKDLNDMILSGLSTDFVKHIIDSHSFGDLRAQLELSRWTKV